MKMWLNNRKVKEADYFIMCDECVFMRIIDYDKYNIRCLSKTFNLLKKGLGCKFGYQYEDNV